MTNIAQPQLDRIVGSAIAAHYTGAGSIYPVQTNAEGIYVFYINTASDIVYVKSTDAGVSWSDPVAVLTGTATALSVWYDRWSGIAAGLIHIAYTETVGNNTLYRNLNVESSDALSTEVTVFDGASAVGGAGNSLSIVRARGGNVYCKTCIDAATEGGFFRLPNANVTNNGAWDAARTDTEALAANDTWVLVPGWTADNQDIMCVFNDASADELSRYVYDDSANTWAETSFSTSMVDVSSSNQGLGFAITCDLANSRNIMIGWSANDTLNADLRCWYFTEAAMTEATNVVLNSTDDQGMCGIAIDTTNDYWYAFYMGKSDGSETMTTSVNIYYKVSTDHGTTWGAETQFSDKLRSRKWLSVGPRFPSATVGPLLQHWYIGDSNYIGLNTAIGTAVASTGGARIIGG